MLVGAMNHPARPLEEELRRIAAAGFDFVDLTLEPPRAWPANGERIGALLTELGLAAVGHTAYFLPIASPFPELQAQARRLVHSALDTFAAAGIRLVNLHPDPMTRLFPPPEVSLHNARAIAVLADDAAERGVTLMIENLGHSFSRVEDLEPIFEAAPRVAFHLDVGHANIGLGRGEENRSASLLEVFGSRLAHVHVSDNFGLDDLHLPLGAGNVDWPAAVRLLRGAGWDGTVTLEVFAAEHSHIALSRRLWLDWWASEQAE
jgi:sugar phosphate isomerase/epimerase